MGGDGEAPKQQKLLFFLTRTGKLFGHTLQFETILSITLSEVSEMQKDKDHDFTHYMGYKTESNK